VSNSKVNGVLAVVVATLLYMIGTSNPRKSEAKKASNYIQRKLGIGQENVV